MGIAGAGNNEHKRNTRMSTAHPTVAKTNFWTADRVADALGSVSPVNLPRGQFVFGRVSTDTRTIESGDLFVALAGERFDAHDFLKDAVAKGATGLVVSRVEAAAGLPGKAGQARSGIFKGRNHHCRKFFRHHRRSRCRRRR